MLKKKRRKLKVKNIVLMFIFLCIISVSIYYIVENLNPYNEKYFIEKGYTSSEIEFILSLENSEKDKLLERDKIQNIINHYTIEHYTELITIGYNDDEISKILKHDATTITFILNYPKIEDLLSWFEYENFIPINIERYLKYLLNNPNRTYDLIIEYVNTNRDFAYYTNIQAANLDLNEGILVNKYFSLDENYIPNNLASIAPYGSVRLVKSAAEAFIELCQTAKDEGYTIIGISGYRSYQTQAKLYNRYLQKDPQWLVDTYSARAGHSEHQTGLVIDVSSNNADILTFEMSQSFKWMKDNAHKFGFILRFQKGKEDITGYKYEPWHYRYVGKEIATTLYQSGMTLDEYVALNLFD